LRNGSGCRFSLNNSGVGTFLSQRISWVYTVVAHLFMGGNSKWSIRICWQVSVSSYKYLQVLASLRKCW
jgi:hypothetical protein